MDGTQETVQKLRAPDCLTGDYVILIKVPLSHAKPQRLGRLHGLTIKFTLMIGCWSAVIYHGFKCVVASIRTNFIEALVSHTLAKTRIPSLASKVVRMIITELNRRFYFRNSAPCSACASPHTTTRRYMRYGVHKRPQHTLEPGMRYARNLAFVSAARLARVTTRSGDAQARYKEPHGPPRPTASRLLASSGNGPRRSYASLYVRYVRVIARRCRRCRSFGGVVGRKSGVQVADCPGREDQRCEKLWRVRNDTGGQPAVGIPRRGYEHVDGESFSKLDS